MVSNANTTLTTAANFIPEIWASNTLDAMEFSLMLAKLVNRDYEGEIKSYGDTVRINHINNYTAQDKSSGVLNVINFEAITQGQTTVVVDTHKYAAFQVEKFAQRQVMPGFMEKNTKKLGYALGRAMDVSVATLPQGLSANNVGTYGVELTDNDYNAAWQKLAEAGVLQENQSNSDVVVVLSAAAYAAALRTDRFTNRDYSGDASADTLHRANVGDIYGSRVYMSNLLRSPAGGQHDNVWFHKDIFALCAQQMPEMENQMIIEQLADAVACHTIYGIAELTRPVETAGSASTTDNWGVLLKSV